MRTYTQDEVDDMVWEARQQGYDNAEEKWQQGYDRGHEDGFLQGEEETIERVRNSL